MGKIWGVLKRDVMRLVRTRKVWVIVIGALVTPALYAWFNINAFWDPYSATANIHVAVVNEDQGATSELTGHVDIGAQVVDQLRENDQLGWEFMDADAAQHAVRSGDVYAAIIIPTGFSSDLLSITTGDFTQPALQYFVNEKASAIAPKITDVGASTLDKQITSAFTAQVASAATEAVKQAGDDVTEKLKDAQQNSLSAVESAATQVADAQKSVGGMQQSLSSSRDGLAAARGTLSDVSATLGDVQTAIAQAQKLIADAQQEIVSFTDAATSAYVTGASLLADASASANVAVTELTGAFQQASGRVDTAISEIKDVAAANAAAIEQLQAIVDDADIDPAVAQRLTEVITALQERNAADQQLIKDLGSLNDNAAATSQAIKDAADAVSKATANASAAAKGLRTALTDTVPALSSAMAALSSSAGQFSSALGAQQQQIGQADQLLSDLDGQLVSTSDALASFGGNLAGIKSGLDTARTDIVALGAASVWGELAKVTGLNPADIAGFLASPVNIDQHVLFPIDSYGSAMAALFTNLSLWIGCFMLMVLFKVEVDTAGVEGITVREAYLGRFLLLAILAALQAVIVCVGNLIIGVQTASAVAFVGTGVLLALAYLSIVYALCVAFGHVGRGLCVLLVIMQIPGASGLYPIELMPAFFRGVYPFLPFTYGINAMRETIGGFEGAEYWRDLGMLAIFVAIAFLLGLVVRRRVANLAMLFNRRIAETDLLVGETVQVADRGVRLEDVLRALNGHGEHDRAIARRSATFNRHYPNLVRVTLLTAVVGLVVLGVAGWALPGIKATLLGIWVIWCLLAMAFLVVLDYVKASRERALRISELDDEELRELILDRGSRQPVAVGAGAATNTDTAVLPAPDTETAVLDQHVSAPVEDADADTDVDADADTDVLSWLFPEPAADPETPDADAASDDAGALLSDAEMPPESPDGADSAEAAGPEESDRDENADGGERS
ncbi:YhgE/Pip domain-containing protein [Microbacterium gorillae]|uniref:YhgE/Pip domain-containing protein n=1 Tax=Microbacterium gorillae TaxID=1231063 RepID=UPI00058EEB81|nr:YhgE/Pip domain-containing protein [Microbacterium gorillae]